MPLLASALKKVRHDRRVTARNNGIRTSIRTLVKQMRKKPEAGLFQKTMSALDKAAKKHVIHKNRASRLKSRLARLLH